MASEKYRNPPQAPPLFTATPESIAADTKKFCDETRSSVDSIVANVSADNAVFDNVIAPALRHVDKSSSLVGKLAFYRHVSTDEKLREASANFEKALADLKTECNMREDFVKLTELAFENQDAQVRSREQLHALEHTRRDYIENGLHLPAGPNRDRFNEIQKRLGEIKVQYRTNLNEEKGAIWFTPEELEGVRSDYIDIHTLEKGTGENEGKVKLSFKGHHHVPLMAHAVNADTRRKYMIAVFNKARINVPLFQETIVLRDEVARLCGYDNYASFHIEKNMAKSPANVISFLENLRKKVQINEEKEISRLREYKKKDHEERGLPVDNDFFLWDFDFYSRIQEEKEYSVDETKISEYFPVESTFAGMLKIFEKIFGFVFVELKPDERARLSPTGKAEDIAWHEDVLIYSVWDDEASGGSFCGYLYLDLHPRDGKYCGNAKFSIEPGYIDEDGKRHYPVAALVCNLSKPSLKKPSLLNHHEVKTVFHELGHAIHDLASRTRYSIFHGTSKKSEFSEAPSQMLENWCWIPEVLKSMSKHWETNEQIPDDLIEKLVATKHHNLAIRTLFENVVPGIFDMSVHTPKSQEAVKQLNTDRLWTELLQNISGIKGPEELGESLEWSCEYAQIGHFIEGFGAGYYFYAYSKVISLDMFHSFFAKNPMDGKEGRRYRYTVLEKGGSIDEMDFLKEYLGREPNSEAFDKELGLYSPA